MDQLQFLRFEVDTGNGDGVFPTVVFNLPCPSGTATDVVMSVLESPCNGCSDRESTR